MRCSTTALAAVLLMAPGGAAGQSHPLVGVWTLTYPGGMRVENGVSTPIDATARLTIAVKGDSLVADLVPDPVEGRTRPAGRFAAKLVDGTVTFVQTSEATLNFGGQDQKRTAITRWTLSVVGDVIEGSVDRSIEGMELPMGGPQPVSGVRKAAP